MNKRQGGARMGRIYVLAGLLLLAGCREQQGGAVAVTVIGGPLRLVDPAAASLTSGEAVLLQTVAQGLVRFDAQGQIEAGLAERWNVSDDGLSYIFRLASGEWPDGRKITAHEVARLLRRQLGRQSENPLKDAFGAVAEIVAMTERVIEIRLKAPRPNLLQLLAQPELALLRNGEGTGPFTVKREPNDGGAWLLEHEIPLPDGEDSLVERVALRSAAAEAAVRSFIDRRTELVLGGTFADLGFALGKSLPRGSLRFDPAVGLFGLVPAREGGPIARPEVRALLDQAIDREALIAALGVPDLAPRATILHAGLEGFNGSAAIPTWSNVPTAERRDALAAEGRRLFAEDADEGEQEERPRIRLALPQGPGAEIVLERLRSDWEALGVEVERSGPGAPADLRLVDLVAPSLSPAWFLRQFRCGAVPICEPEADALMDAARQTTVAQQRAALLGNAERELRRSVLFLPIAAPVRWSLVGRGLSGFAENRFSRHPLLGLRGRAALPRRE
ncbi:ABC transporter substrate-binding protein [Sphingomonas sp. GCM10030256]|uniref:ABC transporter substrate-binding protein n=1 Tax=Sphingomonas sp. GCM10030256 TaxID=3273427 RepID=UPI0036147F30